MCIRDRSKELTDAHAFILELNAWIEEQLRPDAIPGEIYTRILERVSKSPYASKFMGAGENQVKFVAHSVGLELDELPVIAPKYDVPFEAITVLASKGTSYFGAITGSSSSSSPTLWATNFTWFSP